MSLTRLVSDEPKIATGGRFYLLYVLFALLLFPVHESGHYWTYRILGVPLHMTLNTASPSDPSLRRPIAEIAGPIVNLVVASFAGIAFHLSGRRWRWSAALSLASGMMRLVVYAVVVGAAVVTGSGLAMGNDEPIAAHLWGLPSLTFVVIFSVPLVAILWSIVRLFQGSAALKSMHVAAFSLLTLAIGVLIGEFLDPWLFPGR